MTVGDLFINRVFSVLVGRDLADEVVVAVLNPSQILVSKNVYDKIRSAAESELSLEFVRDLPVKMVLKSFIDSMPMTLNEIVNQKKPETFDWARFGISTPN